MGNVHSAADLPGPKHPGPAGKPGGACSTLPRRTPPRYPPRRSAQGNWHLLADPAARYTDLGPDYVASRTDRDKKIRNHVRGLRAMGLEVTLTPAA